MPTTLTNKLFSLYVKFAYPNAPADLKYFYRDTYSCQLVQLKYGYKDYISKKQYKEISFDGEFGQELVFVLPFAYWHYKNGTLKSTRSSLFSKELYFFSPNHSEEFTVRTTDGNYNYEIPRIQYSQDYNVKKWLSVPFKQEFKNNFYKFSKPLLIIANRYNMEWDGPPISFFDLPTLEFMITNLKNDYTIVYNRPRPENISTDNSETYDLGEFEWLEREHPEVILMENLYKENIGNANNFNHLQLLVYANASHFISVHGGTSILASYFGGVNLIMSKQGPEHHFECFHKLYPKLSGTKILLAKTNDEVKEFVRTNYMNDSATSI